MPLQSEIELEEAFKNADLLFMLVSYSPGWSSKYGKLQCVLVGTGIGKWFDHDTGGPGSCQPGCLDCADCEKDQACVVHKCTKLRCPQLENRLELR